jgi:hypothetical protein
MKRLWQRIKCLLGYHGFSGLVNIDTYSYGSAHMTSNGFGGTFVEKDESQIPSNLVSGLALSLPLLQETFTRYRKRCAN